MPNRFARFTLVLVLILVPLNLRIAPVAVGPVLPEISSDFAMSGAIAGVLTSLPTICFAIFGFVSPAVARHLGIHRTIWIALAANIIGQVLRVTTESLLLFFIATITALAGIGVINVLMPPFVKTHWAHNTAVMTSAYATTQSFGVLVVSLTTAPIAQALGTWRAPFWIWAGVAVVALVPASIAATKLADRPTHSPGRGRGISLGQIARTKLGWALLIMFGMQSGQAYALFGWLPSIYQDAGFSPTEAGLFASVMNAVVLLTNLAIPTWLRVTRSLMTPVWTMAIIGTVGFLGVWIAPTFLPWLWAALMGLTGGFFPLILVLLSSKTRTQDGTSALSTFAQSGGYLPASILPFLVGTVQEATNSYTWPVLFQIIVLIPIIVCAIVINRSNTVEDELDSLG